MAFFSLFHSFFYLLASCIVVSWFSSLFFFIIPVLFPSCFLFFPLPSFPMFSLLCFYFLIDCRLTCVLHSDITGRRYGRAISDQQRKQTKPNSIKGSRSPGSTPRVGMLLQPKANVHNFFVFLFLFLLIFCSVFYFIYSPARFVVFSYPDRQHFRCSTVVKCDCLVQSVPQ